MKKIELLKKMTPEEAAFACFRSNQKLPCWECSFFPGEAFRGYPCGCPTYRICKESFEQWEREVVK